MFSEEAATRWSDALVLMGYASWVVDQGSGRWGVWSVNAGLLLTDELMVQGWLRQRWLSVPLVEDVKQAQPVDGENIKNG